MSSNALLEAPVFHPACAGRLTYSWQADLPRPIITLNKRFDCMKVGIVGCGYVADFYMLTLRHHRALELMGATDFDAGRAKRFGEHHNVRIYPSLDDLLGEAGVELVLNLTNPRSHFAVTQASLKAGKHVYSEKPLAMSIDDAEELVELAENAGLYLSSAPSRVLGEPAQTMWKALRSGIIGRPRLVYAEMDDGLINRMDFRDWRGNSGSPWPFVDEFETGCTLEHAGYALTWLAAFFGPAETVTAFSSVVIPDRDIPEVPPPAMGPDFSVACIRYSSGVVARLTCSTIAPEDHSIRIFGDEGVLSTDNCWKPDSPVFVERRIVNGKWVNTPSRTRLPMLRDPSLPQVSRTMKKVDFNLGPLEMLAAIAEKRPSRLSARFSAHIAETVLAIHGALEGSAPIRIRSSFDPLHPMPWAG